MDSHIEPWLTAELERQSEIEKVDQARDRDYQEDYRHHQEVGDLKQWLSDRKEEQLYQIKAIEEHLRKIGASNFSRIPDMHEFYKTCLMPGIQALVGKYRKKSSFFEGESLTLELMSIRCSEIYYNHDLDESIRKTIDCAARRLNVSNVSTITAAKKLALGYKYTWYFMRGHDEYGRKINGYKKPLMERAYAYIRKHIRKFAFGSLMSSLAVLVLGYIGYFVMSWHSFDLLWYSFEISLFLFVISLVLYEKV